MQTFKRWLNKLFAWWSWKRLANMDKPQPAHEINWNVPTEGSWRSTAYGMDQSIPQPGSISIVVEQYRDNIIDVTDTSQTRQSLTDNPAPSTPIIFSTSETDKQQPHSAHCQQNAATNMELHLQFLRYLVQRGTFNDDLE